MENAELTAQQRAFLRGIEAGPKTFPDVWPKWLTDLWIRDFFSSRGRTLHLTEKGKAEIPPDAETEVELVVVVGISSKAAAAGAWRAALPELEHEFPAVAFSLHVAQADFVDDGRYMVVPFRGNIGDGTALRPMPPAGLVDAVGSTLDRLRFLEQATVQ